MPNYMVIVKDQYGLGTEWFDTYDEASEYIMTARCGVNAVTELYERVADDNGEHYEFLED